MKKKILIVQNLIVTITYMSFDIFQLIHHYEFESISLRWRDVRVCVHTLHDHLRLMAKYIIHFSRRSLSLAVKWDTHTHFFMVKITSPYNDGDFIFFYSFCAEKGIIFHWSNYLLTSSLNNSDRSGDRHMGEVSDREVLTGKMVIGRSQKKIICSRRHVNSIH